MVDYFFLGIAYANLKSSSLVIIWCTPGWQRQKGPKGPFFLTSFAMLKISQFILLLYVFSCFISPSLKTVFLISGLITWFLYLTALYEKKPVFYDPDFSKLNYLFLAFVLTKLAVVLNQGDSVAGWVRSIFASYLQWFWFASLLLASVKQKTFFKKFSLVYLIKQMMVYIGLIESVYIIFQLFGVLPAHGEDRTFGILSQPFTNAGLMLASSFVTASMIKKDSESFLFVALLAQILGILILGQVSVILGLFVALLYFVIVSKAFKFKQIVAFLVLVAAAVGLASLFSPRIERKVKWFSSIERLTTNRSISCRYEVWKLNIEQFKKNPILGNKKIIPYECVIKDKVNKLRHTHNIYLQKLVEGGVVKFVTWFAFYLMAGIYLFSLIKKSGPAGFCFFLAISIEGFLENWWGDSEVLAIFFFMVIFAKYFRKA